MSLRKYEKNTTQYEFYKRMYKHQDLNFVLKMKQKYIDDRDYIMKWWIPKAVERYRKLLKEKNLQTDTLWY